MNERNVKGMNDQDLVNSLREHAEWAEGNQWETPITLCDDLAEAADRLENQSAHIVALQQEIEKLRGQNEQLREAAALVAKESVGLLERWWIPVEERLPEVQSWGASTVVLGLIKSENEPYDLTLCVYCDNGIWSMPGRYVAITHWMPLPEPPEEEK